MYGWSSFDAVDVVLLDDAVVLPVLLVVVLVPMVLPVALVELFPPTMVWPIVVLPADVVFPDDVMLPVLVVLVDGVAVWFVVVELPVSKIRVAIVPLAENVDPVLVEFELVVLPVLLVVVFPPAVVLLAELVLPAVDVLLGVVPYCAIAGVRLSAAAKSPKTSTSATAIGAFFIAKSAQE